MCGITGIVQRVEPVDLEMLGAMTRTLRHRGPDDEDFFAQQPDTGGTGVGLGFRRLSIIDVAGGRQPIANEDGTVVLVFNGEVYNFQALRTELSGRGHVFRTRTDSEVIVHLYEEAGPRCVDRLNGMFAFAIWDTRRRVLLLARDRLGEKPLYYAETPQGLIFASELKALLAHRDCPRTIDGESLELFLTLDYVPSPKTIFAGVHKLPAGHLALVREGRVFTERYWDLEFCQDTPREDSEWIDEFRSRLSEAVRARLVSDVPLGAFLSGGVDSSSVAALMAEHLEPDAVKTFSIGFAESSFDESAHARRVAAALGVDHHEQVFTSGTMLETYPFVLESLDEPFADPSIVPTYLLSRFARESVTVALGGDGSDELLAGYPTFQAEAARRWYRVPRVVHERVVLPASSLLPVSTANFSRDFKLKRFLRGAAYDRDVRHAAWLGPFLPYELSSLLVERSPRFDPYEHLRRAYDEPATSRPLERLVYQYARTYLQDDILVKVDRASMLASLEVRSPFLDHTLVEFLGRVPPRLKLRGLQSKVILKRAMRDALPSGISARPKKGFGIPVAAWFKGELREALQAELSPDRLRSQGIFWPDAVERLVREHLSGRRDNRKELWALFVFQHWHRAHLESPAQSGPDRMRPVATPPGEASALPGLPA
jgi:asparagine synthase (glutamine-hydrolysing)